VRDRPKFRKDAIEFFVRQEQGISS
jgi:hypothetical protein